MDVTNNQAEQVIADLSESVEEIEPCECSEHRCHLSPPRTIQTFENTIGIRRKKMLQANIDHLHRSVIDCHFCAHNYEVHFLEELIL